MSPQHQPVFLTQPALPRPRAGPRGGVWCHSRPRPPAVSFLPSSCRLWLQSLVAPLPGTGFPRGGCQRNGAPGGWWPGVTSKPGGGRGPGTRWPSQTPQLACAPRMGLPEVWAGPRHTSGQASPGAGAGLRRTPVPSKAGSQARGPWLTLVLLLRWTPSVPARTYLECPAADPCSEPIDAPPQSPTEASLAPAVASCLDQLQAEPRPLGPPNLQASCACMSTRTHCRLGPPVGWSPSHPPDRAECFEHCEGTAAVFSVFFGGVIGD